MLQQRDFFANISVAASAVPREGFAADEELRDPYACDVAEYV